MKRNFDMLPDQLKRTESIWSGEAWQKRYWFIFSGQAFSIIGIEKIIPITRWVAFSGFASQRLMDIEGDEMSL